tara:strand:- start:147 stop:443 length:297 start_codon:yes stop_codon:yes gene_type:complete
MGSGFVIRDILDSFDAETELDPFLIWHELPKATHKKGQMPGAPMHPHRGFMECPYAKEFRGATGLNFMRGKVEAGGAVSAAVGQWHHRFIDINLRCAM